MSSLNGTILWLTPTQSMPHQATKSTNTLDAAIDQTAFSFSVSVTENITRVGFFFNSVIGSPVPVYKVSIQGVNATDAKPNGTIKNDGGGDASTTFTPVAGWQWITLDQVYAATMGEVLSIVIEHSSETIDGSNNAIIVDEIGISFYINFPKAWFSTDTGSSWTKAGDKIAVFAYGDTATAHEVPFKSLSLSMPIATNDDRLCNKFTLPSGSGDTFKVLGLNMQSMRADAAGDIIYGIWNAAGVVQQSVTLDPKQTNPGSEREMTVYFDSVATLNFGTPYYYGIQRVTVQPRVAVWDVAAAADQDAFPLGQNCIMSEWDETGSAWTDTPTKRILGNLILDDITEPAGGGGGTAGRSYPRGVR